MKRIPILLLFVSCCSVLAQPRWTILQKPTFANLNKVCFVDTLNGWVAGDSGIVLHTTNTGTSWEFQATGIDNEIHELFVLDKRFAWALAFEYPLGDTSSYGTIILRTTNGGVSWESPSTRTTKHLYAVSFINANTGVSVGLGGTVIRTTDAGDVWITQTSGVIPAQFFGTSFTDTNTGTVVGSQGAILRTTNGGVTWANQSSGTVADLFDVCFIDANTGTAIGNGGVVLRTTNGGAMWTGQSPGVTVDLFGVSFVDGDTGTVVGKGGTVIRTTNGGDAWTTQVSGIETSLLAVSFPNGDAGTAVGTGGTIITTTNGGAQWTSQPSGTTADLNDVFFINTDTGTVVGNGGIVLRTTNRGASWTSQLSGILVDLTDVFFTDANTGIAVGQNGAIIRTINGGASWASQSYPVQFFYALTFFDSVNGLMAGERGAILKTTNGGVTWSPTFVEQSIASGFPIRGLDFFSRNYGFALGGHMDLAGVVWKTTSGGERWTATSESGEPIYALHFIDSLNLLAVGGDLDLGSGMIRSTNGGRNWQYTYLGIWGEARALSFRTPAEGYAPLGFTGTYMMTTDTGSTWRDFYSPDSTAVHDVMFIDSTHGFMVGKNGTILKYNPTTVSVAEVDRDVPLTYRLFQNYPNPFNPSTVIRYELPEAALVVFKVYDVAGREVKRLVIGTKEAGEHSLEFKGGTLASGVYYYELAATNSRTRIVQAKKMVLIK